MAVPEAVKIRAEDGRRVCCVDISPFINNLPLGRPTHTFSSDDASGSTSQSANIQVRARIDLNYDVFWERQAIIDLSGYAYLETSKSFNTLGHLLQRHCLIQPVMSL